MNKKKILIIVAVLIVLVIIVKIGLDIRNLSNRISRLEKKDAGEVVLFLGDSLTERYDLNKYLDRYYTINSGVGGNLTTDILNDMDNRVYKYNPSKVFLLVGVNDILFTELKEDEISKNIESIKNGIYEKLPNTHIYLISIYPVNLKIANNFSKDSNNKINKLNKKIKRSCTNNCTYIDINKDLKDKKGNLKRIYTKDGVHINRFGYCKVTKNILKYLDE